MNEEKLSGALQENILCLLCFDDTNCKLIRAAVTPQLFESSVFKEVAGHAIDFIDQYGEAIKEHLPDHLESILEGEDTRKASTYKMLLDNLYLAKETVNGAYVLSQLHKFVRQQTLKDAVIKAVEALEDGRIDQAEVELHKGLNNQAIAFEAGLNLSDANSIVAILDSPEEEGFELGIPEFDKHGIIPRRKELFTLVAPRGRGKSWGITHIAKQALVQRWSVVIVSLEMSEKRYAARILQSFFSISRRESEVKVSRLIHGDDGKLVDILSEKMQRRTMQDEGIRKHLLGKARRDFKRLPPLRIKQFATGSLDLMGLKAYLDGLERFEKFTPDLICIDYPKLMKLDSQNLRIELGALGEGLRGIAIERNAAMVIVAQGNRESESAALVTGDMVAEDISLLATADTMLTYSQTAAEHKLGLARLFVEKSRNEVSKMQVLITQAYSIGQFALDSHLIRNDYWSVMQDKQPPPKTKKD